MALASTTVLRLAARSAPEATGSGSRPISGFPTPLISILSGSGALEMVRRTDSSSTTTKTRKVQSTSDSFSPTKT